MAGNSAKKGGPRSPSPRPKRTDDTSTQIRAAQARIAANLGYLRKRYNLNDNDVPPDLLTRMQKEGIDLRDISSPNEDVQARAGARLAHMIERDRIKQEFGEDIGPLKPDGRSGSKPDAKPAPKPAPKPRDRSAAARKAALTRKMRGR